MRARRNSNSTEEVKNNASEPATPAESPQILEHPHDCPRLVQAPTLSESDSRLQGDAGRSSALPAVKSIVTLSDEVREHVKYATRSRLKGRNVNGVLNLDVFTLSATAEHGADAPANQNAMDVIATLPPPTSVIISSSNEISSKTVEGHINSRPNTAYTADVLAPSQWCGSEAALTSALKHLREVDALLAAVIEAHGPPFSRFQATSSFMSLTRSILSQQISGKAAESINMRLIDLLGGESNLTPQSILAQSLQELRLVDISERKGTYLHALATFFIHEGLNDHILCAMDDEKVLSTLTQVKGIGPWTVQMLLIFHLKREDVFPLKDLGVKKGVQKLYGLSRLPSEAEMVRISEPWRPYRSIGTWYMWRLAHTQPPAAE